MLNRFIGIGRIANDLQLRTTQSGVSVLNFTIAVDRDFKNGGEKVTDFIDCVCFRQSADFLAQYGAKGRLVCVDGQLQSRKWQDKDGKNRTSWEISCESVYTLDRKPDAQTGDAAQPVRGNRSGAQGYGAQNGNGYARPSAETSAGMAYNQRAAQPRPSAPPAAFSPDIDADDTDVPF